MKMEEIIKLNMCVTCLSSDRRLVPMHEMRIFVKDISFTELKLSNGGICWECKSIIIKFHKFKTQAKQAMTALAHKMKVKDLKPFSSLVYKTNVFYDHHYHHSHDPLTYCDNEPKTEDNHIKEEFNAIVEDNEDNSSEIDEKLSDIGENIDVYVETIEGGEERQMVKERDIHEQEIKDKFLKVVFSEEEMMKKREDKRNHYNFRKIPYKCDSCVLGFTRKETYNLHMEKKHDENLGQYTCDVCLVRFASQSVAVSHRERHFTCYRCKLCKYDTTELWRALNHCRMKHENDQLDSIHCTQCDVVVKSPIDLEEHIQMKHTLHCNECGVRFKGKDTLRRHKVRIHTIKREFVCDICSKTFKNKTRLESHMVRHNAVVAKNLSFCHVCNVQYKNIFVYRNHLKNSPNHLERSYPCPECNKKFASKVYRTRHYNFYHLQKSQYHCEICNKLFISDWRLKDHRQKHHGLSRPRDHTCNVCGKKFFTNTTLRNHQLTHSEQRSYMCEDCGDTFKQRPALYTHIKLVHGDGRRK